MDKYYSSTQKAKYWQSAGVFAWWLYSRPSVACRYFATYGIAWIAKIPCVAKGWQAAGGEPPKNHLENRQAKTPADQERLTVWETE